MPALFPRPKTVSASRILRAFVEPAQFHRMPGKGGGQHFVMAVKANSQRADNHSRQFSEEKMTTYFRKDFLRLCQNSHLISKRH
jgi:hypothetical protein